MIFSSSFIRTVTANKSFQNWIIQASDGNQITKEAVFILSSLCCSIITYKYGLLAEPGLLCQADKALSVLPRTSQRAHLLHGPDGTASFRATEISAAAYVMFFHKETFPSLKWSLELTLATNFACCCVLQRTANLSDFICFRMNWFALLTLTIITLIDNCLPAESVCCQMGVVSKTCATTGLWTTLVDAVVGPSEVWSHMYFLSLIVFTLIPFLVNSTVTPLPIPVDLSTNQYSTIAFVIHVQRCTWDHVCSGWKPLRTLS